MIKHSVLLLSTLADFALPALPSEAEIICLTEDQQIALHACLRDAIVAFRERSHREIESLRGAAVAPAAPPSRAPPAPAVTRSPPSALGHGRAPDSAFAPGRKSQSDALLCMRGPNAEGRLREIDHELALISRRCRELSRAPKPLLR
jgi:hypothetical protein